MDPKITAPDPLRELDLFDPDTGKMVRGGLAGIQTALSPESLSLLVDETIWGLSREVSFGQAIARGMLSLLRWAPSCLSIYRSSIHLAGAKGPTLGRLMATHLVPVLICGQSRIRRLFFETFEVMENAGVYTITKPLEALDRILRAADGRSAEAYLRLLRCAFSRPMPYNRRQQLSVLLPKAALRYAPVKRPGQLLQLQRVMRIDDRLASALVQGMDRGLDRLPTAALSRFVSQGLDRCEPDRQRAEKFFALESRAGRSALAELQVAASFLQVQPQLNQYLQARTGHAVSVRPLSAMPRRDGEPTPVAAGTCSGGHSIYLPDEIDRFDNQADNLRVYKCLTRLEAGLHEFGTFQFDLEKALEQCSETLPCFHLLHPDPTTADPADTVSDLQRFFDLFPEPLLAADLFLIFEHGRIRHLLTRAYPGLVFTCLPMFQREVRILMSTHGNRQPLLPLYAQIACGLPSEEWQPDRAGRNQPVREAVEKFHAAVQQEAGVPTAETSGHLTAQSYAAVDTFLEQSGYPVEKGSYSPLLTPFGRCIQPDFHHAHGWQIEQMVRALKKQLADRGLHIYASVLRNDLVSCRGELRTRDLEEILQRPENYTRRGRTGRPAAGEFIENRSDEMSFIAAAEWGAAEPPCEDRPSFWYREWDCRLGDYLSEYTRVLECTVETCCSDFYTATLRRYAGLVQRIRSAFELLKPQGLKWYRRWIEGDEFDYRQLLDFALDRKAGRSPSERLYNKRIKAQRDVAVLLLVDLSRSTANRVAGSDASVLDVEKEAIVLLSEAMQVVGDQFAIEGFSGSGRQAVEYFRIKDFSEPLDDAVRGRINAMSPRRNTRMGAAIRHAASRLSAVASRVKLLILLGDGFPNDLNYKKTYAVEDTRRAIAELRAQGAFVHAITVTIDPANTPRLDELYGDIHYNLITEAADLPDRLWRIYGALTR